MAPLPQMEPASLARHLAAVGTTAAPPYATPPCPALLTMLTGLEGALPQQLLPSPQVQLVGVRADHVIHMHMAHAHRASSVLGDTHVVSADTDVALGWSCDPRASQDTPQGTTGPSSFLVTLPQGPDLGTWEQSGQDAMGTGA